MADTPRYWFPAKRYGWGWGIPSTWQGWVVMIAWLAIILTAAPFVAARGTAYWIAFLLVMSALLLLICYAKGEPTRWRWGDK